MKSEYHPAIVRKIDYAFLLLVLSSTVHAQDWVITQGGLSPDKRLGVAVYPQKTENIDEANGTVLLVNALEKKAIGPLEEIDSTGGSWGKTTENVSCQWSADSKLLAVNFRAGRISRYFQLYRIRGHRAIPIKLPRNDANPKGKILEVLEYNANPGSEIELKADGTIIERAWGFIPKEGHWVEDYSRYGLKDFEDRLYFIYHMDDKGRIQLVDITTQDYTCDNSKSPDGRFEIKVRKTASTVPREHPYAIDIVRLKPFKHLFTILGLGTHLGSEAYWHPSSRFVVICDVGSKQLLKLSTAAIKDNTVWLLQQPDYMANALRQIEADREDYPNISQLRWDGDNFLFTLHFNAFGLNGRTSYTFEVVLHLVHGENIEPSLELKSVTKLKEEEA